MSIDVYSLMSCVDMRKLLDKETLEKGRVIKKQINHNIQINDLVKAMISSEPCLFNNSSDNLMKTTEKEQQ